MKKIVIVLSLLFLSLESFALVNVGGYVPFGRSTQKEVDGTRNTLDLDPMISFNTIIPMIWSQLFMPEAGFVFHSSGVDGASKRTTFLLLDFGYQFMPKFVFRYGVGTFITRIKGDGGVKQMQNGFGTDPFYLPSKSSKSYNTTLDLGVEYGVDANYALRFQTYMFSPFGSKSRKLSYSFSLSYYL
ncbi:MAG: hypothetical protein GY909_03375 [Oligoflexia bacterium]|nr:hypothetical protein [Oligoflexia bacterium]